MNEAQPNQSASRLGQFILARLLAAGQPPTRSDFDRAVKRYFADRLGLAAAEWRELLDNTLREVQQAGLIEQRPFRLTERGRAEALAFLGIESVPASMKWQAICNRCLVAKALEVRPRNPKQLEQIGKSEGVRAAVLVHKYQLPIAAVPTMSQALHALSWKQLTTAHSFSPPFGKDFTRHSVLTALMMNGQAGEPAQKLPALAVGAKNNSPDALRIAVIRNWLNREDSRETEIDEVRQFDLRKFADRVKEIARTSPNGRYGENKVFISSVWDRFEKDPAANGMTADEFHRCLTEANRENLLALSRADLVEAMNPADVAASEIRLAHSTFHFIRTDR